MYRVRMMNLGQTRELDKLAGIAGALYSRTVVSFWRTVRKGTWLSQWSLMRWHTDPGLHAHTADGEEYVLRAIYRTEPRMAPTGSGIIGVDLGEVHIAAASDGKKSVILNGRYLRSKRRYQNKLKGQLAAIIAKKKRGSRRYLKIARSKRRQLRKLQNQIRDVLHKQTSYLGSALHASGAQTIVIGDLRDIRHRPNRGRKSNQRLHQWLAGQTRRHLQYKAASFGMQVELIDERYTSQTCPACGHCKKPSGRLYRCGNCRCVFHRDGIGAHNIRAKYRGFWSFPVVGANPPQGGMASPVGVRFHPHVRCSSFEKLGLVAEP